MSPDQKAFEFYKRWKNVMNLGDGLAQQFVTELAHAIELFHVGGKSDGLAAATEIFNHNRPARDE